jgi:hypothetical protein
MTVDGRAMTDWQTHTRDAGTMKDRVYGYGDAEGQLGRTQGNTFWAAALQIVAQCYRLLPPGGYAVWVVKDYMRHRQLVPFTHDWARLCEHVGFVWLHHHQASLVQTHGADRDLFSGADVRRETRRESFFRRLSRQKTGVAIDHESVLCFRKPRGDTP